MWTPCGIAYNQSNVEAYLPLEDAQVHANVVDVSAIVTITQHFWQYASTGIERARYVFPVPARAAVCGFEMTAGDATISAITKEKGEAQHEHDIAISQGQMTGLVEHVTDDIFSISLGALPGRQMVTTVITYVLDLMEDDVAEEVRLQLPGYIGHRFGALPNGMKSARKLPPHRIRISVDIHMQGPVRKLTSPTHPTFTFTTEKANRVPANAQYSSREYLEQDFVLIISAEGLDAPRCFAQQSHNGALAIQLNIVPKFVAPPIEQQEYIFLVDRSGSMEGSRIEMAKRALVMLLRALPSQGTWLNVLSFGTYCDKLWAQSGLYDELNMRTATTHIDSMSANYGGTNIDKAVEEALRSRMTDVPTAVFVLTDGESYAVSETLKSVQTAMARTGEHPVRLFTLGIGESVSTEMCEGIARIGGGVCLIATTSETIVGKCSRLVRASRSHIYRDVSVDWGISDVPVDSHWDLSDSRAISQTPSVLPPMYPGNRFVAFALSHQEKFAPPKEVVVQAKRNGSTDVLRFSVPVQVVDDLSQQHPRPLIQTLAARRAIMELEDQDKTKQVPIHRAAIIALGVKYQLVSTHTSFIAVDKRTQSEIQDIRPQLPPYEEEHQEEYGVSRSRARARTTLLSQHPPMALPECSIQSRPPRRYSLQLPAIRDMFRPSQSQRPSPAAPAGEQASFLPRSSHKHQSSPRGGSTSEASSTLSRFIPQVFRRTSSSSTSSAGTAPVSATASQLPSVLPPTRPERFQSFVDTYDPTVEDSTFYHQEEYGVPSSYLPPVETVAVSPPTQQAAAAGTEKSIEDNIVALIRLQTFDGCFAATAELFDILGGNKLQKEAKKLGASEDNWATALAISYLRAHMKDQPDLLQGIVEKAMGFLALTKSLDVGALLRRAEKSLPR